MALVAKFRVSDGLLLWSIKSQTSMPSVLVMKITPGRVGEKAPQVLCEPKVLAERKIGWLKSSPSEVFQMQKWKSWTVRIRSSKKGERSSATTGR
jgi:hypothetical protein